VGESFAAYVSLYVLAALVIGALLLPWASRSLRACLASTEYAKARGISAKDFPLYNFTGSGK
jgi:ABC-type Fe3+-siderophore transport system permease subunit